MMLAAGTATSASAGLVNLANVGTRVGAAHAAGGAGLVNLGVGVTPQQALQASQPSIRNLATAAQGIAKQIAAQQAAAAAGAVSNVPNGLAAGGLEVAPGVSADRSNPNLWINANLPTQTLNGNGTVDVDVKQTAQNAVLTWKTMNVGTQTTLNFDQSAGTQSNGANNWVVLNRIADPSGAPSQILGHVNAQGTVLVINRNGILFGPGSQVNVHSLVASSLDLLNTDDYASGSQKPANSVTGNLVQNATEIAQSNQLFLNGGLAALEQGTSTTQGGSGPADANEVLGLGNNVLVGSASQYQAPGDITIAAGASINTAANASASDGGLVLIAAPNVTNAGSITVAPAGQVVLAAGVGVALMPNSSSPQVLRPELTGRIGVGTDDVTSTDITPAGTLINTGVIQAARGEVNLLGSTVKQNGVVGVTTSVNTPGAITISTVDENIANTPTGTNYSGELQVTAGNGSTTTVSEYQTNRAGQLVFGPGSVTTVLPDEDGQTATSSPGQTTFSPGSVQVTAGSVWFQSGSLVEAPGATVQIAALTPSVAGDKAPPGDTAVQGRIYVDDGATIDVSGLANVELPISDILLTIPTITANELADSPLLRNSFLLGMKNVTVDSTLSGTNGDGVQWVGSPLLNLAGDVSLMPRTVDQLMINGGTITLAGNEVMTANGSQLNLNGGYIHYLGGMVNTTRLVDADGVIVPIGEADPNDTFVGVAGQFVENHARWGITRTWLNPLLAGGVYEDDYIVGGNAGTLNVFASSALVLDGSVTANALSGEKQVQGNDQATGGSFDLGAGANLLTNLFGKASTLAELTQGDGTLVSGQPATVIVQNEAPQLGSLGANFGASTPIDTATLAGLSDTDPANVLVTAVVPVATLNSGGFANVSVTTDSRNSGVVVARGTTLQVQPGGSITFTAQGQDVTILGSLIAPSGTISIPNSGTIVVGPDSLLSVAGQWVNNDVEAAPGTTPGDSEFINGGTITLSSALATANGADNSGSIMLEAGSTINVSSGGEMQANGQLLMKDGIPEGRAGNLSLMVYSNNDTSPFGDQEKGMPPAPSALPISGQIVMDGTIRSMGFSGGGTLTMQATGFQIGGDPASTPVGDLYLPASFFAQQGFGGYVLNALYDVNVAPDATVALTQRNLMPTAALLQAASGSDIATDGLTSAGALDAYHRQPTNLVMTGGAYLAWKTASGTPPVYAGVTGGVSVGEGAAIVGDAGASIGLGSPSQVTVLGSIVAPGGAITLSADSDGGGYALPGQENPGTGFGGFTSSSKSVWLGADSVLDVAGVALTDPLAAPVRIGARTFVPDTGKVLAGGSVTISDDSGYIVAQAGSRIDVSGTSAVFDELQPSGQFAPSAVWSNAGSITLGASSGLLFDGTLQAKAGAAQGEGGTLTIVPEQVTVAPSSPGAQALVFQQSGSTVPAGLTPGADITAALTGQTGTAPTAGVLTFSVDRLADSGISSLVVAPGTGRVSGPVPIEFSGNVNLTLPGQVVFNTWQLVALDNSDTVSINAPYVALIGPSLSQITGTFTPEETVSDSTLTVNASFIDLENQLQVDNFGQSTFRSTGDIRLSSTNGNLKGANALASGELFSAGNMVFQAADLYPSTGSTFILDARGPDDANGNPAPTTITFLGNGSSGTPLSAGGTLLVDATNIVQQGTVRAPSGSLIFGVGDPNDAATKTQFDGLPLVATDNVSFGAGSITSVSLDGATVPYGTTVDGIEWQFNPVAGLNAAPDVTAPPAKYIGVNGSSIALNQGATIDLSGGGDLQAQEWVAGTGGTRDVLSQYNVSYANSPSGTAVPVNVGAANVYAILPGAQSPVAAYDPILAQTTQPTASGTMTTDSMGVGHAGVADAVGESVYLSGVPGLPAGYYTLLPAKYATLPGAFRVTMSSASGAPVPGASQTLPDGTVAVAGYFGNALTGSRSATPTLFDVQSGAVWQQYSQYTLTSANRFFPPLAQGAGNVTPPLPMDAGQLVLAASSGLSLGSKLDTAAAPGGAPAEVDIASQDIQIVGSGQGSGEAALPGYLQLSADQLDALGAGSLLIGGTRTPTAGGITINAISNSVVVSNDAANPLTGQEIILVTKSGSTSTDPNAANGLRIDSGSVIAAQGSYPAAKDEPVTIGADQTSTTNAAGATTTTPPISGDGALLEVTNGGVSVVTRHDTTGTGLLTVAAGATLSGGQAITLDSSGNLRFDPAANLSGNTIAVDSSAVTFTDQTGAAASALPGFVVGAAQLAQLANAKQVILRSSGAMNFDGTVDVTFGNSVDLSAGSFSGNGGAVTLNGPQIAFTNEMGAPVPTGVAGAGTLTVNANEIDFGTGNRTLNGFGAATMNATGGIVSQGTGTFDFGAVPVTLNAPVYVAGTGSQQTVQTTGVLTLNSAAGKPLALTALGGAWSFIGGTLNDNDATIEAPAGNVSLEATTGDLDVNNGSQINTAGVPMQFFDVTEYAPAGAISLKSDIGTVNVAQGATLDFAGAQGGGAAGSLTLAAPGATVNLAGTIDGHAANGFAGGSFSINTGGAVDLDGLATELASSGVNDAISVQSGAGNLVLSAGNTLTAKKVSLTADGGAGKQVDTTDGNVLIFGTIDASGAEGGTIELYGKSSVDIEGTLKAIATTDGGKTINPDQRGGAVNIGTSAMFDPSFVDPVSGTAYNSTYGYESISSATTAPLSAGGKYLSTGAITIGSQAVIDVSGGTAGGLSGGTVNLRAPLLSDGSVPVSIGSGAQIKGSRATSLEAYAVWSTTDTTTGAQHFDGIVDPAGWYQAAGPNGTPQLVAGQFTDKDGNTIDYAPGTYDPATGSWTTATLSNDPGVSWDQIKSDLAKDLETDYFAPTTAIADHQTFYGYQNGDATAAVPGTLMGFVQNGVQSVATQFANTGIKGLAVVPGIELDNPSPSFNDGNISVVTNWNLGAGASVDNPAFRFGENAPIITFRAENNVEVKASLTDGFFQIANPLGGGASVPVPSYTEYANFAKAYALYSQPAGYYGSPLSFYTGTGVESLQNLDPGSSSPASAEYYALYSVYAQYLDSLIPDALANPAGIPVGHWTYAMYFSSPGGPTPPVPAPVAPSAADQAKDPGTYLIYIENTFPAYAAQWGALGDAIPAPAGPAPQVEPGLTTVTSIPIPAVTDNTPSPVPNAANPLPLSTASLVGGSSSSFRVVSGANFGSSNPLAVQAAALVNSTAGDSGSVILSGTTTYTDPADGLATLTPTMIRTGTGSISVAAANDVWLYDPSSSPTSLERSAPGVIYTAGKPALDAPAGAASRVIVGDSTAAQPDLVVSPTVNPEGAGDISITAQHDINGLQNVLDVTGAVSNDTGGYIGQFWNWLTAGNVTDGNGRVTQSSVDFGGFGQGVMSVGGNVSVVAGHDITDLAVSLPTTWYSSGNGDDPVVVGGGNLSVAAGNDIRSGEYMVGKGTATLSAGGQIASDGIDYARIDVQGLLHGGPASGNVPIGEVPTLLATTDGAFDVTARQGAAIGGVFGPGYFPVGGSDVAASGITVETTNGDIGLDTLSVLPGKQGALSSSLPASINLVALTGGISIGEGGTLAASATSDLSLIADQTIHLSDAAAQAGNTLAMSDEEPDLIDESQPVRIYSLNGSIVAGVIEPDSAGATAGFYDRVLGIDVDKPAFVEAGVDIVNLVFDGQNLRTNDVTRIVAGHDIYDTPFAGSSSEVPHLVLGGPGYFDIEAGRNIGPFTNIGEVSASGSTVLNSNIKVVAGINAVGNGNNPKLPHESASVNVLFGVAPGIDDAAFIANYIDPSSSPAGVTGVQGALVTFMQQYDAGQSYDTGLLQPVPQPLSVTQAWQQFQALPKYVQQLFIEQVFFSVLTEVGNDYNNPASPFHNQYARGYQAINTLFPSSLGYTANALGGGANGANTFVQTGNLDIRSTTIQTQQGGTVSVLGPGGEALIGSSSAPPEIVEGNTVIVGPGQQGVLTLEKGDIDIFTDQSLLLAQSRVFTEQGGGMTIWSSNGNIDAGKGATSSADIPPPQYVCDVNHFCTVDAKGVVTGAGIATLQTIPGSPPGDVNLLAPRGTVDAGAAGIRVSGNLNVAALQVLNAANISVQGKTTGVPVVASVDTGALTAASAATSAVTQMAQTLVRNNASGAQQRHWAISVQVEGFGDSAGNDNRKKKNLEPVSYDPEGAVSILGLGGVGDTQRTYLSKREQGNLGKLAPYRAE